MGPPHLYEKLSQINTDWYFRRKYNILVCTYFEKERIVIEKINKIYIFLTVLHILSAKVPAGFKLGIKAQYLV